MFALRCGCKAVALRAHAPVRDRLGQQRQQETSGDVPACGMGSLPAGRYPLCLAKRLFSLFGLDLGPQVARRRGISERRGASSRWGSEDGRWILRCAVSCPRHSGAGQGSSLRASRTSSRPFLRVPAGHARRVVASALSANGHCQGRSGGRLAACRNAGRRWCVNRKPRCFSNASLECPERLRSPQRNQWC